MSKTATISINNVKAYLIGNIRYKLYYSRFKFLLPHHIIEQYELRLLLMDEECYNNGTCKMCGCMTTNLQFANKQCDKPCYPPMFSLKDWARFISGEIMIVNKEAWIIHYGLNLNEAIGKLTKGEQIDAQLIYYGSEIKQWKYFKHIKLKVNVRLR